MNKVPVDAFEKLLHVGEVLMGPQGCPWDREQTLVSLRGAILEEACEVIEAIDNEDDENLAEELGDLLYQIVFVSMVAQKEKRFSLEGVIDLVREKLIHRHPHVFGDKEIKTADEVLKAWEEIKAQEKSHRTSLLDGIPKGLPALARGYKIAKKIKETLYGKNHSSEGGNTPAFESEEELGELLWDIVKQAKTKDLNPENALRKVLFSQEETFRAWESTPKNP